MNCVSKSQKAQSHLVLERPEVRIPSNVHERQLNEERRALATDRDLDLMPRACRPCCYLCVRVSV